MTTGTQQATNEAIVLLQNNDVAVTLDLELSGADVPSWDDVEVQFIAETRNFGGVILIKSSATGGITLSDAPDTVATVTFDAGDLAVPLVGKYVVDVIDPTAGTLTYRYGTFQIKQTREAGELSGWVDATTLSAVAAEAASRVAADAELADDIAHLTPSGMYLARATNSAQETFTTSETDYTSLSITVPDFARPVEVILKVPLVAMSVASQTATIKLTNESNTVYDAGRAVAYFKADAANGHGTAECAFWIPANSGELTVKARRLWSSGSGTCFGCLSSLATATLTAYAR